ncbi:hypothetical protein KM043_013624 [Ampulex compressa]|nr:hypothetical protein KM043_013624 [Ampulex compressa]
MKPTSTRRPGLRPSSYAAGSPKVLENPGSRWHHLRDPPSWSSAEEDGRQEGERNVREEKASVKIRYVLERTRRSFELSLYHFTKP